MASTSQPPVTSATTIIDYAALYAQEDEGLSDRDKAAIIIITLIVASVAIILSLVTCFCCKDNPEKGEKDDEEDSRSANGSHHHSPGGGGGGGDTCSISGNSPRPLFGLNDAPVGGGSAYTPLYTESPMRFGRTMSGGRRSSLSLAQRTPPSRNLSFHGEPTLPAAAPRPARSRRRTSVSIEDPPHYGRSPENLVSTRTPRARNGDYAELEGVRIEIPPNVDLYQKQLDKLSQHQQCALSDGGGEGGRGGDDDDDQLFTCAGSDTGDTPTSALSSYENNNWDSKRGPMKTRFEPAVGGGGGGGDTESTGTITPRQQSSPRIDSSGRPIDRGVRFVDEDLASTGDAVSSAPRTSSSNLYDGVDGVRKCTHCGATFRGAISICPVAGISHKQLFEEFQRQKKAKREIQRRMRPSSGQHHNTFSEGSQ